jgi:hypothetical protein
MGMRVFQKHFSDEELLAFLDGELSLRRQRAAKKHLSICWECRSHLAEIEEQARAVIRMSVQQDFIGPDRIEGARRRFQDWRMGFERDLLVTAQPWHGLSLKTLSFGLAVVVLCAVSVAWWLSAGNGQPRPLQVLAASQSFEARQVTGAAVVHQSFRVEIAAVRPWQPASVHRVDVWSEPNIGRYGARWTDGSGVLQDAVWHPTQGQEYVYSAGAKLRSMSSSAVKQKPLTIEDVGINGISPEEIRRGFMSWLESQDWRPVSLSSGMAAFVARTGVVLRAARIRTSDGHETVRLTAEHTGRGLKVEMRMDVDAGSDRPLIQTIRFEAAGRIVELKLVAEQTGRLALDQIDARVFEPDSNLLELHSVRLPEPTPKKASAVSGRAELAALEVEVLHRLDDIGAILGEQVSVARTGTGRLVVQAAVETEQRKEEMVQALADFKDNSLVELKITTVAEAKNAEAEAQQAASGRVILRELEVTKEPTPAFAELRQLFRDSEQSRLARSAKNSKSSNAEQQDDEVRQFAKKTLGESQQALLHAWALKHFVERFSPSDLDSMSPDAKSKWRALIREHAEGFRKETAALRLNLQPVFFPDETSNGMKQSPVDAPERAGVESAFVLGQVIDQLFEMASANDEALRSAFVISAESQSLEKIKSVRFLQSLKDSEALARLIEGHL